MTEINEKEIQELEEQEATEIKEESVNTDNSVDQNANKKPKNIRLLLVFAIVSISLLVFTLQVLMIISTNNNIFNAIGGVGVSIFSIFFFSATIIVSSFGLRLGVIYKFKPTLIICAVSLGISIFADMISVSALFACIDNMLG
jgi:hypothetical protein